jgi:DNA helicase HerA-like ATPase
MDLDPTSKPDLYWSLVLAGEIARGRWNDDVEADYDFEHFRAVADELCDFLLGAHGPEDIAQNSLAANLRSAGIGLALGFRALLERLESFEIWRGVGDQERDIADVLTSERSGSSATVIDLLSVNTEAERLALTTRALTALWRAARESYSTALRDIDEEDHRVPTIVVIDEAHNIVPMQRTSSAAERLAADVIRIAAEGRKFGLFLLVITQRPRKLDPSVLSECDGLFLMKMTNESDLKSAAEIFGFLDPLLLSGAKELKVGDVFLQGRLGRTNTVWHVAPRRTMQGGKSLDDDYWTDPRGKAP